MKAPAVKAPAVTGVTAHQIVLGTTTPLTGPAAPGYSEIAPATNAVFKYVNAHGGIYGRKIKYIIDNDEYDPSADGDVDQTARRGGQHLRRRRTARNPDAAGGAELPQLARRSRSCSSSPAVPAGASRKYPDSFGWQPNYIVEGKILGHYVEDHLGRKKVGFLYQDDEFGLDGVKGLNEEIPAKNIVGEQNYQGTSAGLAAGLGAQISALKAAGAKLVVLYTIPAATALALLAAAGLDYHPVWVVSSVGSDPPTLSGLLSSFSKGAAGASLLNGMITNAYLPPESQSSNAWIKLAKSILGKYEKGYHWDGNSEYGVGARHNHRGAPRGRRQEPHPFGADQDPRDGGQDLRHAGARPAHLLEDGPLRLLRVRDGEDHRQRQDDHPGQPDLHDHEHRSYQYLHRASSQDPGAVHQGVAGRLAPSRRLRARSRRDARATSVTQATRPRRSHAQERVEPLGRCRDDLAFGRRVVRTTASSPPELHGGLACPGRRPVASPESDDGMARVEFDDN